MLYAERWSLELHCLMQISISQQYILVVAHHRNLRTTISVSYTHLYKIVNRKRWRFIIIDMRHLFIMERSEEKREEKGKGKREKENRERVRVRQSAATELLQTQPLGYLILHSSLFTLH